MKHLPLFAFTLGLFGAWTPLFTQQTHYPKPTDIVKQYFAAVDAGRSAEVAGLLADNCMSISPIAADPMTKQAWIRVMQEFKTAFPDLQHDVAAYIESGFTVVARGVLRGLNSGPLMGNPPTGNRVSTPFNTIFELDKSWKIKAIYGQFDLKTFEAQLMAGVQGSSAATEANIRAMFAAADEGNGDKFMGFWAADGINFFSGKQTSGDDMKMRILGFKKGFPDIQRTLDEVVVSGNNVTVRGWVTGTNTGPFRNQAPTGRSIKVHWLGFYKLNEAGKIQKGWVEFDTQELERQLYGSAK
jgi:steroid delta-isomerase-like uncharacterized protein